MKKLKFIAIMACSLIFASCTSTDSLIDQYEKACKNNNIEKMVKIGEKLDKKNLTEEQRLRVTEIALNCAADMTNDFNF